MIRCWLESNSEGFGGGEYVLAALPPIGSAITARAADGSKHRFTVRSIELGSIRQEDWQAAQKIGGYPDVTIFVDA